jgi:hypothetical protein
MISWALALALLLGAFVLHAEIAARDLNGPRPRDPYRAERLRNGESLDPDNETSPDPCFPRDGL